MSMTDEERSELIERSVKARKLEVPEYLKGAHDIDGQLTDEQAAHYDQLSDLQADFVGGVGSEIGINNSCWSICDVYVNGQELKGDWHDFTANPFVGAVGVAYGGGWGQAGQVRFRKKLENVTLADVWKACDQLIDRSGDHHHVFIETLKFDGKWISFHCGS